MTPQEHYDQAEALLTEGTEVINKITSDPDNYPVGPHRNELRKKAMGIWAQAQVHATLAGVHPTTT